MKKKQKILILVPSETARGGITNYYKVLKDRFTYDVSYFKRGARQWPVREGWLYETIRALKDLVKFFLRLRKNNYAVVQTNTSLGYLALLRDGIFILVAKLFKAKTVVFFRGLDLNFQNIIEKKYLVIFKYLFFLSDCAIVLSSQFKNKLFAWGYKKTIYLETTVVDEGLIKSVDYDSIRKKYSSPIKRINLLFLARIERAKGIYETIDTYLLLKKKYPQLELSIAGDGFELENIKEYIENRSISGVKLYGFVSGIEKRNLYKSAHIYIFPSYTEGMPNSLLEAMAFGLPIITRPVGGITDFFENGANGFMTETKDPKIMAILTEQLLVDTKLMEKIALHNYYYAKGNFTTSKVIQRLEEIYREII